MVILLTAHMEGQLQPPSRTWYRRTPPTKQLPLDLVRVKPNSRTEHAYLIIIKHTRMGVFGFYSTLTTFHQFLNFFFTGSSNRVVVGVY